MHVLVAGCGSTHPFLRDIFEVEGVQGGHKRREDSCFDGVSIRVSAKASHKCQGFCQVEGGRTNGRDIVRQVLLQMCTSRVTGEAVRCTVSDTWDMDDPEPVSQDFLKSSDEGFGCLLGSGQWESSKGACSRQQGWDPYIQVRSIWPCLGHHPWRGPHPRLEHSVIQRRVWTCCLQAWCAIQWGNKMIPRSCRCSVSGEARSQCHASTNL